MRTANSTWVLSWLLLCGACEGTSTGNPTADPNGGESTGSFGNCKEASAQTLALDAQTALGFRASDILALAEGEHRERLTWHPQASAEYGPESGERGLTIVIERKGEPRLVHYAAASTTGTAEINLAQPLCMDAVEIAVRATVKSEQGALNETIDGTLVARSGRFASLALRPKDDKLTGSFAVTKFAQAGVQLVQLSIGMAFTEFGSQGSFGGIFERRSADSVSARPSGGPLASWGLPSCTTLGIAIPHAAELAGLSGDDVIAELNRSSTASVSFDGSSASATGLSFSAVSTRACAELDDGALLARGGASRIYVQAALRVKSADGRLDGSWPVAAIATPDEHGAIAMLQVTFDDERRPQGGSLDASYGIRGIDTSGVDSFYPRLELSATAASALQGELMVMGLKLPSCSTAPNPDGSTNACPGGTPSTLARIRITGASAP